MRRVAAFAVGGLGVAGCLKSNPAFQGEPDGTGTTAATSSETSDATVGTATGAAGSSSGSGGPIECERDAFEDNDSREAAPVLGMLDETDITMDDWSGVVGPDDEDWYRLDVMIPPNFDPPTASVSVDDDALALCVYFECQQQLQLQMLVHQCLAGERAEEMDEGLIQGCCGTSSISVDHTCAGSHQAVFAYVQISGAATCADYTVSFTVGG